MAGLKSHLRAHWIYYTNYCFIIVQEDKICVAFVIWKKVKSISKCFLVFAVSIKRRYYFLYHQENEIHIAFREPQQMSLYSVCIFNACHTTTCNEIRNLHKHSRTMYDHKGSVFKKTIMLFWQRNSNPLEPFTMVFLN